MLAGRPSAGYIGLHGTVQRPLGAAAQETLMIITHHERIHDQHGLLTVEHPKKNKHCSMEASSLLSSIDVLPRFGW
jgi:hypothetical protein